MDIRKPFKHIQMNDNFNLPSKGVSVPKDTDKSIYVDLQPDGYASECLAVEFMNGDAMGWPYSLMSKLSFRAGKELVIQFSDENIVVQGVNLAELFRYLTKHQVITMRERDSRGFELQNSKLSITKIEVKQASN
jgi:antitoxin component of MazEF toxin-antitoxin module